jgi:hypothetical protein
VLPIEKWPILIRESHPGYITWDAFMANQKTLASNRPKHALPERRGAARNGIGLLQGVVLCGRCGQRMRMRYIGRTNISYYWCDLAETAGRGGVCWTVGARAIDEAVEELFLSAVQPAEIDLSLAVMRQVEGQATDIDKQWKMRLERAQYEVRRAEKRYRAVDPEYRLVARTLEREWEEKLREVAEVEREYAEATRRARLTLSESDRATILALAKDLRRVWRAPTTTNADRKTMVRMLVKDVVLRPVDLPVRQTAVDVIWQTGASTHLDVPRPGRGPHIKTPEPAMKVMRALSAAGQGPAAIAMELNRRGLRSGSGQTFTAHRVHQVLTTNGLRGAPKHLPERRDDGLFSVRGAAKELGVSDRIIYYWAAIGRLQGERDKRTWWFRLDDETLERLGRRTTG